MLVGNACPQALHIAATARCMLPDGRDASPTCKFNINACEPINSTASCPHARIFFASDDSHLKANALNWWARNCINPFNIYFPSLTSRFGPCAVVPPWESKHSGTQFGGSDAEGFMHAMTEWWMMAQSDVLVHTGMRSDHF